MKGMMCHHSPISLSSPFDSCEERECVVSLRNERETIEDQKNLFRLLGSQNEDSFLLGCNFLICRNIKEAIFCMNGATFFIDDYDFLFSDYGDSKMEIRAKVFGSPPKSNKWEGANFARLIQQHEGEVCQIGLNLIRNSLSWTSQSMSGNCMDFEGQLFCAKKLLLSSR